MELDRNTSVANRGDLYERYMIHDQGIWFELEWVFHGSILLKPEDIQFQIFSFISQYDNCTTFLVIYNEFAICLDTKGRTFQIGSPCNPLNHLF